MGLLDGKVAIVTGAGRGIGRGEALLLAQEGAKVVVNDLGGRWDGTGSDSTPAGEVVKEIKDAGGEAVANYSSVTDYNAAKEMVQQAVDEFGDLNILVNNAGILRDRMIFNMSEDEFDIVVGVHLKGTFNTIRHAAEYWRAQSKAGKKVYGRVINTTSDSGLTGNPGQGNYGAAKAGIASFTIITSKELKKYGVTVNAVCPAARTRMTIEGTKFGGAMAEAKPKEGAFDPMDPGNIAPVVVYLASEAARRVNGEVIHVMGANVNRMIPWKSGKGISKKEKWTPQELIEKMPEIFKR
ncbi:MAG: SDR family oxidoreductase [Halobacteriota archaeon]|nr:SDR family oxidoreductase [Halobacteriota archaeon]